MIEFILLVGTMVTPSCPNPPCYTKMEIDRWPSKFLKPDAKPIFTVINSTPIARCEVDGHKWQNRIKLYNGDPSMECSICWIERKIRRVQKKREVTDTEEYWEDDGSRVIRSQPINQFLLTPNTYDDMSPRLTPR